MNILLILGAGVIVVAIVVFCVMSIIDVAAEEKINLEASMDIDVDHEEQRCPNEIQISPRCLKCGECGEKYAGEFHDEMYSKPTTKGKKK